MHELTTLQDQFLLSSFQYLKETEKQKYGMVELLELEAKTNRLTAMANIMT